MVVVVVEAVQESLCHTSRHPEALLTPCLLTVTDHGLQEM
jgi:hypothetical protein